MQGRSMSMMVRGVERCVVHQSTPMMIKWRMHMWMMNSVVPDWHLNGFDRLHREERHRGDVSAS